MLGVAWAAGLGTALALPSAQALSDDPAASTPTTETLTETTPASTSTTPTSTSTTPTTTSTTPTSTTTTPTTTTPPPRDEGSPRPPLDSYPPPAPPQPEPEEEPAPRPAPAPAQTSPSRHTAVSEVPPPETCRNQHLRVSAATAERVLAAVRCLVDGERAAAGLLPLGGHQTLDVAAERHARDMADRGYFGHTAPDPAPYGPTVRERLESAGYRAAAWGENLAAGQRTAGEVVDQWLRSPSHRRELLGAQYTELGVGVVVGDDGRPRWAQAFGRPQGAPAPVHPGPAAGARSGGRLSAGVQRRAGRLVVRGRLRGAGGTRRRVRVTAVRGARTASRTVRVRPGSAFAVGLRPPRGTGRVRVVVRVVGDAAASALRLTA